MVLESVAGENPAEAAFAMIRPQLQQARNEKESM